MSRNEKILSLKKILIDYLREEKRDRDVLEKTLNQFAIKIQQQYRSKQQLDRSQKAISDYLCNKTGNKIEYRQELFRILQANNTPHRLQNQYFYYCKFGKDSLGIDKKDKTVPKLIKEINNCLFLNTSFASTNFDGIKFKLTKFLDMKSIVSSKIYQNLMKRSESLRSVKTDYKKYDSFKFDNANLINCFFEECLFHSITFLNIKYGVSDLQIHKYPCPTFLKCKYNNCVILLPEENKTDNLMKAGSPYYKREYEKLPLDIRKKYEIDYILDLSYKSETTLSYHVDRSTSIPLMIYENCDFKSSNFRKLNPGGPPIDINRYLYINCTFNNVHFTKINIYTSQFVNCKFIHGVFNNCNFDKTHFKDCYFEDFNFDYCNLGNTGHTEFTNTKFKTLTFKGCAFQNYLRPLKTCIIHDDCQFDDCTFNRGLLVGFNFNFDYCIEKIWREAKSYNKMLQLTRCKFICCEHYATSYDYCTLEGSHFISPIQTCGNHFSWLGNTLLSHSSEPVFMGKNKTEEFKKLFAPNSVDFSEFTDVKYQIKESESGLKYILKIRHNEWMSIGNGSIDPYKLSEIFNDYDYIELPDDLIGGPDTNNVKYLQFLPATSMKNTNIKACNFQSAQGFKGFDFTQIYKTSSGNPDLTATNFTDVNLSNANLRNAKLIGTIFQAGNINGTDFFGTQVNENTDFENTLNIGQAVNAEHIQFGSLQEKANETHARAKFVVNNRNKLKKFYSSVLRVHYSDLTRSEFDTDLFDILKDKYGETFDESSIDFFKMINTMVATISMNRTVDLGKKNSLVKMFPLTLAKIIAKRLNYNQDEETKLLENLNRCFTPTVIDIMFTNQPPRKDAGPDAQDRWSWLAMVYQSVIFLLTRKKLYIQNFITYYFDEVFNAHSKGSPSCPIGYLERWVTIHSQTAETYLMLLKVDKPDEIKEEYINSICEYHEKKKDEEITRDYMEIFNNFKQLEIDESEKPEESDKEKKLKARLEIPKQIMEFLKRDPDFEDLYRDQLQDDDEKIEDILKKSFSKMTDREIENLNTDITKLLDNIKQIMDSATDPEFDLYQGKTREGTPFYELFDKLKEEIHSGPKPIEKTSKKVDTPLHVENKYLFNRLINLIKPHSNLSEKASEEVKEFSFDITPEMRNEWQKRCSKELIDGKITTLNQVLVHFVENIRKILLESYSITDDDIKFYSERQDLPAKKFNEKIKKFIEFLKTEQVERLQQDMVMMCDLTKIDDITLENLKYYVEGGSRKTRSFTLKKGKTRSHSRLRSLPKLKTIRARSLNKSKQQEQLNKLLESIMLKQFVNLSKEKFEIIFCKKFVFDKEDSFRLKKQDAYDNVVDDLRGMDISDKPYRLAVKRRHDEIKNNKLFDPAKIYSFDEELEKKTNTIIQTKKLTKKLTKNKPSRIISRRVMRRPKKTTIK